MFKISTQEVNKRIGRGRRKGESYTRNKPLYKVFVMADGKNKLFIGEFTSYNKIAVALGIKRPAVQNICLGRIKKKYKNIIIECINKNPEDNLNENT